MDSCALILVGLEGIPPLQARMTFTMGRHVLVEMAQSSRITPSRYTGGDRLDHAAFLQLQRDLNEAGYSWNDSDAEEILADLRATYEPLLDGLARYLLLTLPEWNPRVPFAITGCAVHGARWPASSSMICPSAYRIVGQTTASGKLTPVGGACARGSRGNNRRAQFRLRWTVALGVFDRSPLCFERRDCRERR
jgi:hypothetical protein